MSMFAHIGSMSDRIEDIRKGFLILLPVLDEKGRAIIYVNNALMGEQQVDEVRIENMMPHDNMSSSLQIID